MAKKEVGTGVSFQFSPPWADSRRLATTGCQWMSHACSPLDMIDGFIFAACITCSFPQAEDILISASSCPKMILFSMKPPLRERIIDLPLLVNHFPRTDCLIEGKERAAGEYLLATNEKNLISQVLQKCNWNKHETAPVLGISRTTTHSKLKKHKIQSHER
ncbi:MAG: helix-turn-helix domain-containing protein [Thermodesulfobacteriota bacterium]|nr:helix-turn-helix domain-containing protein [Thermodesulfobacteriota bacterium]